MTGHALPAVHGTVVAHGAQVLSWRPRGHEEVLFLSSLADYAPGVAIRGGVPVVFPWFGRGRTGDLAPAHGFGRLVDWREVDVTRTDDAVTVVHELVGADAADAFPWPFRARQTVTFAEALAIELTVENTGPHPFSYEAALHTYLRVSDIAAVSVHGLDGVGYLDQVTGAVRTQPAGALHFTQETDRIYDSPGPVAIRDTGHPRTIRVSTSGAAQLVVWNPWEEKAARMGDLGSREWREFVCIEAANVGDSAIELAPGAHRTMRSVLEVS